MPETEGREKGRRTEAPKRERHEPAVLPGADYDGKAPADHPSSFIHELRCPSCDNGALEPALNQDRNVSRERSAHNRGRHKHSCSAEGTRVGWIDPGLRCVRDGRAATHRWPLVPRREP